MGRCLVFQPGESYGKLIIRRYPKVPRKAMESYGKLWKAYNPKVSSLGQEHCVYGIRVKVTNPVTASHVHQQTTRTNLCQVGIKLDGLVFRDIEPSLEFHTDSRCFPNPCDNCPILHSQTTTIWP